MKINKVKVLTIAGIFGTVSAAIASGIGTYKAYPKIKEAKEKGMNLKDTTKYVAGDYIPAIGLAVVTSGTIIASEVLGERKAEELKRKIESVTKRLSKTQEWYKNQTEAISEITDEKTRNDILEESRTKDKRDLIEIYSSDIKRYYDPITNDYIETSEAMIKFAENEINKDLTLMGVAYYDRFYALLKKDIPDEYKEFGWSLGTASAMWVEPWINVKVKKSFFPGKGKIDCIEFEGEQIGGNGYNLSFTPEENPESEEWL